MGQSQWVLPFFRSTGVHTNARAHAVPHGCSSFHIPNILFLSFDLFAAPIPWGNVSCDGIVMQNQRRGRKERKRKKKKGRIEKQHMSRGHGQVLRPTKHPTRTPKSVADLALSACFHFCFQCGGKSGCTVFVPGRCRLMAPPTLTGEHPSMGWRKTVAQSNVCVCVSSCGFWGVNVCVIKQTPAAVSSLNDCP